MVGHELAPQGQRVLPGGVRDLVDEAFEVDRVLVQVHAAPEAGRHMRVAHGVVDQQVGEAVADRSLGPGRAEALVNQHVLAVLHGLRRDRGQDGLARDAHVQARDVAVGIHAGRELALRDRVEEAVLHVFLARPDQLDGRARHRLGDLHGLGDEVAAAAPAETAAQVLLVDLALCWRQARRFGRGGERGVAVLRRDPDLAALGGPARGGVHGLHAGVVLVGVGIHGLDAAYRGRNGGRCIAVAVADTGGCHRGVEPALQGAGDAGR